jgi:ubiquinone/menaquinone biosynthesis C-methylase UbiE
MTERSPEEISAASWAGEMGDKWNTHLDQFESMISAAGDAAISHGRFAPGEAVVDIGSGGGVTCFQIAPQVGADGHVTGVDLSPTLIETSRARATAQGYDNVDFLCGDAAVLDPPRAFDVLFSRFGVMFFEDSYSAFRNLRRFVRPGGRLSMCVWGPPPANPWVTELMAIVRRYVDLPPLDPRAPGPFAFSDREYVGDILTRAGFADLAFESWTGDLYLGGRGADTDTAAKFLMDALFVGDVLRNASEDIRQRALADIRPVLERHERDEGVVLRGNTWLVGARG